MATPAMATPAMATPAFETPAMATPAMATPAMATPAFETPAMATPAFETPAMATPSTALSAMLTPATPAPAMATPEWPTPAVPMPTMPTPVMGTPVTEAPPLEKVAHAEMAVPASIPPYRPLRPTPIITPAIRTPLYIPPIPTPAAEAAVEDEGVIDPLLVNTAEFEIPSLAMASESAYPKAVSTTEDIEAVFEATASADLEIGAPETGDSEVAAPVQELPWIDAFLAATPALPMAAIPTPVEQLPTVEEFLSAAGEDESNSANDEWPLEEAAAEFRALRTSVPEPEPDSKKSEESGNAEVVEALDSLPAMAPWSEDDMMDIMPIRHSGKTPLSNAVILPDSELWAERARKAHEAAREEVPESVPEAASQVEQVPEATAEEAAHALELLARRVRAGELTLPSYDPRMGEPAALVAALAALLGVRLR